ncbi:MULTISPECIES: DegT/DnrJ/EryC1/StrS family aminotransferase [Acidobacterium]|uniref:Aminotransferase, DegT/DnrJ/EryC1/StrS family n=1 Tax=Acidobacterium capsulatum (strain ATCC 51196 / DSM 11244 / BCRC 80197 / JCM 7670 / NBRC 15755 / NCIMB 13165 / 161) TaxID=240015 RepID=C1F7G5_ACIC5|nr:MULTISPECIES: DegT/DnrJ/EryC1/StrS family aminotransferase [Acidobacterium]ACO31552.1 aminotransferase, DegT/DnrJ/EryC1/StrS family [Acidobacterium capsulatum ATCC 51196]HCT59362.1 DegT/DnrJ/EryC1/StrS family aminotransferase [Acidobacterium sp.]
MDFIDLKTQYRKLKPSVDARMHAVLDHGQYILGPEVTELEQRLAARTGAKHCITCASGTDALLMAMMALGIGPGDEVITAPFTFFATGEMIALLGAHPVFVDIEPDTYNIDATQIEAAITPRTRAIMPVSLYGQCADMDAIQAMADRHGIPVIEDAAQSFGALYKGRASCNLSTIGCTSFFPSKPLGCYGDGGACFTNDDQIARVLLELRNHGQDRRYHHIRLGLNGRMDTLQAAVLLAKLEVFDTELVARSEAATRYAALLRDVVPTPQVKDDRTCVWAQYTIEVEDRDAVQQAMAEQGIPTAVHYPVPLHLQPVFASMHLPEGSFPVSERAGKRVLSLPMHPYLTPPAMQSVASAVKAALAQPAAR